jgi:hypothetical protein
MKSTFESLVSTRVRLGYAIAATGWVASLFLPAAEINATMRLSGFRVFMIGIDALSAGMPGWIANPVLAAAIVAGLMHRFVIAAALSGAAVVFALSSFYAPTLARAQGLPIEAVTFKVGFFLWLAACSLILATSLYALTVTRRRAAE